MMGGGQYRLASHGRGFAGRVGGYAKHPADVLEGVATLKPALPAHGRGLACHANCCFGDERVTRHATCTPNHQSDSTTTGQCERIHSHLASPRHKVRIAEGPGHDQTTCEARTPMADDRLAYNRRRLSNLLNRVTN
jgi:hypothetical protein